LIKEAISKANIESKTINYIETHGTGTIVGDPIELSGISEAFGWKNKLESDISRCAIGSVKSNIGHLESAATIAGIIKILLQMKYKKLVPSINAYPLNPLVDTAGLACTVQQELSDWQPVLSKRGEHEIPLPRRAGISSFGFGGTNAHMVLCEPDINTNTGYQAKRTSLPPVVFNKKRFWKDRKDKVVPCRDIGTISAPVSGKMAEVKEETLYRENLYRLLEITDESDDGLIVHEDTLAAHFVVPLLEITDESDDEQDIKRKQVKMAPILEITDETENQF
jgi:acyl transferase domain-containing protein